MPVERINEMEVLLRPPFSDEDVEQLKIGDHVRITGPSTRPGTRRTSA